MTRDDRDDWERDLRLSSSCLIDLLSLDQTTATTNMSMKNMFLPITCIEDVFVILFQ